MRKKLYKEAFNKRNKSYIWIIVLVIAGTYVYDYTKAQIPLKSNSEVTLSKCTDGDTAHFNIDGKDETVRFIAIDTPETVKPNTPVQPYGKEASKYTCNALTNADDIKLEYEDGNESDKYDRKIAWVWIDGNLLQLQLISEGLAQVAYLYGDYKYTDQIKGAEANAKDQQKGIWGQ